MFNRRQFFNFLNLRISIFFPFVLLSITSFGQKTAPTRSDTILASQAPSPSSKNILFPTKNNVHADWKYIPPAAFLIYGISSLKINPLRRLDFNTRSSILKNNPGFSTQADNFLQYAPAAAVYGLNLFNVPGKNNFLDRTGIYLIAEGLMGSSILILKSSTHRLRPDASDYLSFPSGHTGTAFAAAEFLAQEYKDVSPWYGIAGYTIAGTTGVLRLYNNKHWLSDVVGGAGIGILSTKAAYLIYPWLKRQMFTDKKTALLLVPTYQNGYVGVQCVSIF